MARPRRDLHPLLEPDALAKLGTIGEHLADCLDEALLPGSVLRRRQVLLMVQHDVGGRLEDVTEPRLRSWWRGLTARGLRASTRGGYRSHVVEFFRWLQREDRRLDDPTRRIRSPRQRKGLPKDLDPARVRVRMAELEARDRLLVEIALETGARVDELTTIRPERDLIRRPGVDPVLRLYGKGAKEREVPLPPSLVAQLTAAGSGWLFPSTGNRTGHLSAKYVSEIVSTALGDLGTAHQLRHTFGTRAAGVDLLGASQLLGHADLGTTQIYTRPTGTELAKLIAAGGLYGPPPEP